MRRYWWVNHKQTVEHEIAGGYLWSPKSEKSGARSQFYENMRIASPGDFIISFADATVRYVGQVSDFAMSGPRPHEFGDAGEQWAREGWLLPVSWKRINNPIRPKHFISDFRELLPLKYSPINFESGNGHQKAYLAEIRVELFQFILTKSGVDLDLAFGTEELATIFGNYADELDQAIERQLTISTELSATEKIQLITSRRGQGIFRFNVMETESACRLTGITNPYFLIASHIKPWRSCITSHERLDGNNGLLLTPHVDFLFDRGFITFQDDGKLRISDRMSTDDLSRFGITQTQHRKAKSFKDQQKKYLHFHRENVFIK